MKRLSIGKLWQLNKEMRRTGSLLDDVDAFINKCEDYFNWCDRTPWERVELVKHLGTWAEAGVPLGRPYSIDELCTYLGVSDSYFRNYKKQLKDRIAEGRGLPEDEDRLAAMEFVETHIRAQQIGGAVVGVFKESIIAKLQGLHETVNNVNTNETVLRVTVRDPETAQNLNELDSLL